MTNEERDELVRIIHAEDAKKRAAPGLYPAQCYTKEVLAALKLEEAGFSDEQIDQMVAQVGKEVA